MIESMSLSNFWETYPTRIKKLPFTVHFDFGVESLGEMVLRRYPHTMVLNIPAMIIDTNGFPVSSEMSRIDRIKNGFSPKNWDFRIIGMLIGGGGVKFAFCMTNEAAEDVEIIVKFLMGTHESTTKYDYEMYWGDNFLFYAENFSPCIHERNWLANKHVVANLQSEGEGFTQPRDIDFYCVFASEKNIRQAANYLEEIGFNEIAVTRRSATDYQLHLTFNAVPHFKWINEITTEIIDTLHGSDGHFDGWGSEVLP